MKKEKKVNKKKIVAGILITLLVLLVMLVLAGYFVFKHYYSLLDYHHGGQEAWEAYEDGTIEESFVSDEFGDEDTDGEKASDDNISEDEMAAIEKELTANLEAMTAKSDLDTESFNILLVGVDARANRFSGRSDAMILLSVNKEKKTITMTSFLRDIYCAIPKHGSNRLNAAFAYGGPELLKSTLQANFGISVDRYMVVNFTSVMEFIDAIGGLDIELSEEEIRVMNKHYISSQNKLLGNPEGTDIIAESSAGMNHLNGNQALAYARVRYVGTDFARTGRQREIVNLSFERGKDMSLPEMLTMLENFLPKVRTDLTEEDFASLLLMMLDASSYTMDDMTIPMDGTWKNARINGMSVLTIDFEKNSDAWYEKAEGGEENN